MKQNDNTLSIIMLGVSIILEAGVICVMLHLHRSLVDAIDLLHYCENKGGIECHIERDGLDYHLYEWSGEES